MQQLLLLRHAKSSWDDPSQSDHARPLNPRGRQAAAELRTVLRELGLLPDVVLVSSARRTRQTLEALAPWDETPIIEPMDGLYLAEPARLSRIVRGVSPTVRSLMLVGHNPGLHEFALMLAGPARHGGSSTAARLARSFPPGALAEFTVGGAWGELGPGGGRLVRFVVPGDAAEAEG
jgi:phosphohistidine phosphatase